MPVATSAPGFLTTGLLNSPSADGYIENQDGTLNSATNPAAAGSRIKLFATGMGATTHPAIPGAVAQSTVISPDVALYASWQQFAPGTRAPSLTVESIPDTSRLFSRFRSKSPRRPQAPVESRAPPCTLPYVSSRHFRCGAAGLEPGGRLREIATNTPAKSTYPTAQSKNSSNGTDRASSSQPARSQTPRWQLGPQSDAE
jgi:hypothetical protein